MRDTPGDHRWYRQAVIYCVDVDTLRRTPNGDGVGDFQGLRRRLTHLARLGVTCLWLNPIHPSRDRDDGYDITDYYGVDPRLGTRRRLRRADPPGRRPRHPGRSSTSSSTTPPTSTRGSSRAVRPALAVPRLVRLVEGRAGRPAPGHGLPRLPDATWSFDEEAGAWYYHRFYDFQPDLNWRNPPSARRSRVIGFWLQLGVSGFRLDAAPFVIELDRTGSDAGRERLPHPRRLRGRSCSGAGATPSSSARPT